LIYLWSEQRPIDLPTGTGTPLFSEDIASYQKFGSEKSVLRESYNFYLFKEAFITFTHLTLS
jgi:hypothetical protein